MPKTRVTIPFFITHKGCPHRCVFCDQRLTGGTGGLPAKDEIRRTVLRYLDTLKPGIDHVEISFFGGTFTGIPQEQQAELLEAAGEFLRAGDVKGIRISTRPDCMNRKIASFLSGSGVTTVELGAQSFSDRVLLASNRGHTSADTISASGAVRDAGMDLVLQLMPGLPGDGRESAIESAQIASALSPSAARIYPAVVIRGTPMEEMYLRGRYAPLSMEEAVEICKEMTVIFNRNGIEVIRTGLHPLKNGELSSIVAGPYHPAFGFLVKSRIKRDLLEKTIGRSISSLLGRSDTCTVMIPETEKEEYIGHGQENIHFLRDRFGFNSIRCRSDVIAEPRVIL